MNKPTIKPQGSCFSSGPCAKRPGWSWENLKGAMLGRSHRAGDVKKKLKEVIDLHRELLAIPADYRIAITPASDTGAVEAALWTLLGARPVEVLAWEAFGGEWLTDIADELKLNPTVHKAAYGELPDLSKVNTDNDVVFTWNGTTSGVRIPNTDWIKDDRKGLTICDATSAIFAYKMDWNKFDVTTWSWQKVLGGEAAHGMIVLSPRAVERLLTHKTPWPVPRIFRMVNKGKLLEGYFEGDTLNTPSMMAVEDCLDALKWVQGLGGQAAVQKRCEKNLAALKKWVNETHWIDFLPQDHTALSHTSPCLKISDPWFEAQDTDRKQELLKAMAKLLSTEKVAYDIVGHRSAPAGLRIWCGGTIETSDIEALGPWLEWAFLEIKKQNQAQAA
ncbi:MAG: phosphoserine transaminase [Alphaproteobacteria bacterium]|nr:phosphoserine transaminase [Alphaproteobacteria bacterium]